MLEQEIFLLVLFRIIICTQFLGLCSIETNGDVSCFGPGLDRLFRDPLPTLLAMLLGAFL